MKRMRFFAVISIVLFTLIGGFGTIKKAVAQDAISCDGIASEVQRNQCIATQTLNACLAAAGTSEVRRDACTSTTSSGPATTGTPANATPPTSTTGEPLGSLAGASTSEAKCSIFSWSLEGCFVVFIKTVVLNIAGFVLWAAANMLNYAIQVGILNFSQWASAQLYPIWVIVRQIVSLFIIFAGLWLGFMYIINKDKETGFEKYIPWVVIFALFVNFSYPLTRAVVDVSNIISLNIYASAVGTQAIEAGISPTATETAGAIIMSRLGLQGLVAAASTNTTKGGSSSLTGVNTVAGSLLVVAFVFYAAYIFFIVTFLIITRTAALVFLIITSPLLFVDTFIPKLGEYAKKMRGIFWEMLFVGPVFMIMLALTLKFLEVFSAAAKSGTSAGGADTIVEFFNVFMMLIMLHIMLKVTKATSGAIGQVVAGTMGGVATMAMGGVAGLGARAGFAGMAAAGRKVIGGTAAGLQANPWMARDNALSRTAFRMTGAVANSSFDARNTSVVQKTAGRLGMSGGMGTGGKLGYQGVIDARSKDKSMRTNFVNNYKKKEENRVRESFNALNENAPDERKKFLKNLKESPKESDRELGKKMEEEETRKAFNVYKNLGEKGTIQGDKEHNEFEAKHKDEPELKARIEEYDKKVVSDKEDKTNARQEGKEAANAMKSLAEELRAGRVAGETSTTPKNNEARLGGGDPNKTASVDALRSTASHAAEQQYVAPVKQRSAEEVAQMSSENSSVEGTPNQSSEPIATPQAVKTPLVDSTVGQNTATNKINSLVSDYKNLSSTLKYQQEATLRESVAQTTKPISEASNVADIKKILEARQELMSSLDEEIGGESNQSRDSRIKKQSDETVAAAEVIYRKGGDYDEIKAAYDLISKTVGLKNNHLGNLPERPLGTAQVVGNSAKAQVVSRNVNHKEEELTF